MGFFIGQVKMGEQWFVMLMRVMKMLQSRGRRAIMFLFWPAAQLAGGCSQRRRGWELHRLSLQQNHDCIASVF